MMLRVGRGVRPDQHHFQEFHGMRPQHDSGEPTGNGFGYETDTCELIVSEDVVRTRRRRDGTISKETIRRFEAILYSECRQFILFAPVDGLWILPDPDFGAKDDEDGEPEERERYVNNLLPG